MFQVYELPHEHTLDPPHSQSYAATSGSFLPCTCTAPSYSKLAHFLSSAQIRSTCLFWDLSVRTGCVDNDTKGT